MNRNCQKGKKKLIIYSLTSLFILHSLISKVETSCFKDVYIKNKIYTYAEKAVFVCAALSFLSPYRLYSSPNTHSDNTGV